MIQIKRNAPPASLTTVLAAKLLSDFLADPTKAVWNRDDIKLGLAAMSHHKCAYCEAKLGEKSQYLEVEHFHCKKIYPELVVFWANLLPSCKHCNISKGDHDVEAGAIIDPTVQDPRSHLGMRNYRYYGKTQLGLETKDVLNLNNFDRNVKPRFLLGERLANYCEELEDAAHRYLADPSSRIRNRVSNQLIRALKEANPTSEFAATAATILVHDQHFSSTVNLLRHTDIWTSEITILYEQCWEIAY